MEEINEARKKFAAFDLDGNNLALNFVNTVEYRNTEREKDWITSYPDALCWAERNSILSVDEVSALLAEANVDDMGKWQSIIIKWRGILYQVLASVIIDPNGLSQKISKLNALYKTVNREMDASSYPPEILWTYPDRGNTPLGFLQPVVQAAADLLVSGSLNRLKSCSDPICGWMYYDTSKNNSRRWCSMKTCGNRAKVNKFYESHK